MIAPGGRKKEEMEDQETESRLSPTQEEHHQQQHAEAVGQNRDNSSSPYFYYQNPTTGTVSNHPLSLDQLIKLLVPVRVGVPPILSQHTQCLELIPRPGGTTSTTTTEQSEWKPVSAVNILKEASCDQWHVVGMRMTTHTSSTGHDEDDDDKEKASKSTPQGPFTCRTLVERIPIMTSPISTSSFSASPKILLYAPNITSEWTSLDELPNLQKVMEVLRCTSLPRQFDTQQEQPLQRDVTSTNRVVQDSTTPTTTADSKGSNHPSVQEELEAFLSSTSKMGHNAEGSDDEDDEHDHDDDDDGYDEHMYQSDGGTRYVKDPFSGRWIHEALAPELPSRQGRQGHSTSAAGNDRSVGVSSSTGNNSKSNNNQNDGINKSKKKTKKKKKDPFHKRNARNWIYVTGLPPTAQLPDILKFFGKVGMLDLDPETLQPKIKLYRHHGHGDDDNGGTLKGDASICYARPESVDLALQVLDESPWDQDHIIKVQRAQFQAKKDDLVVPDTNGGTGSNPATEDHDDNDGSTITTTNPKKRDRTHHNNRRTISVAQRKVARLALLQAQDEGFGERLAGGRKGLRIVVVQGMLDGIPESEWESKIQSHCQELMSSQNNSTSSSSSNDNGVDKITCISKTMVVIVKFTEPTIATIAVEQWNGKVNLVTKTPMKALYWDGVTDYTNTSDIHEEEQAAEEEMKRHEDFGKWLDDQGEDDLPPELRLQVATQD